MNPLETVKSFYAILGSEKGLAALDLVAPSVEWTEMFPGYAGASIGPDAIRQNLFEPLGRDWSDFRVTPDSYVVEGAQVVAFGTYTGVFRKTGKSLIAPFAHRWEVVDGKAVRMRQYTDTALVEASRA